MFSQRKHHKVIYVQFCIIINQYTKNNNINSFPYLLYLNGIICTLYPTGNVSKWKDFLQENFHLVNQLQFWRDEGSGTPQIFCFSVYFYFFPSPTIKYTKSKIFNILLFSLYFVCFALVILFVKNGLKSLKLLFFLLTFYFFFLL